jgi:HlyD family secretion protein
MKKKKHLRFVIAIIVASGLAAGVYAFFYQPEDPPTDLRVYGNVDIRQIELAFHATGRIRELNVEEGDSVGDGMLLAEIDSHRYEAAAAKAAADAAESFRAA